MDQRVVRRLARLAATLGLLVLLVVFVALLVTPFAQPRTHFCLLAPSPQLLLGEPRTEYLAQDWAAFAAVADTLSQRGAARRAVRLDNLRSLEDLPSLTSDLNRVVEKSSDALILYVTTTGLIDEGEPVLLCGSFDPRQADTGRYPLRDFLSQISQCRAAVKLVVLDVGQENSDPRLGTLANEFPRLLQREVTQTKDPTLWVLSANSERERSEVLRSCERSAFSYFVTQGLLGEADLDADAQLNLDELHRFVASRVSVTVSAASQGLSTQTPVLLWGGGATAVPAAATQLVRLGATPSDQERGASQLTATIDAASASSRLSTFRGIDIPAPPVAPKTTLPSTSNAAPTETSPSASAPATAASSKANDAATDTAAAPPATAPAAEAAKLAGAPEVADKSAPAANDGGEAKPPAPGQENKADAPAATSETAEAKAPQGEEKTPDKSTSPATNRRFAALLVAGWQLRDILEDRIGTLPPSVATAPQLWREVNQRLLRFDQRFRSSSLDEDQALVEDLEDLVVALRQLVAGEPIVSGRGGAAVAQLARLQTLPSPLAESAGSLALGERLAANYDNTWSLELHSAAESLAALLKEGNEPAFQDWTAKKLPPGYERLSELRWARQLSGVPQLPWTDRLLALRVRETAERAAARATTGLPWVRARLDAADQQRIKGERALWDHLGSDWQAEARQNLEEAERIYQAAIEDLELVNAVASEAKRLTMQVPILVQWRRTAGPDTQSAVPSFKLLDATLANLLRIWTLLEQPDPTQLSELRRLADELSSQREQLTAGLHELAIEELIRPPGEPRRIENLLATTLPRVEQRLQLLEFAATAEARRLSRIEYPEIAETPPAAPTATHDDWQRWLEEATLERRLCELAASGPTELDPEADPAQVAYVQLSNAITALEQAAHRSDVDVASSSALLEIGTALGDFYRQLPQSIQRRVIAAADLSDPENRGTHKNVLQSAQRATWFVDGRDAQTLAKLDLESVLVQANRFDWLVWHRDRALTARLDAPSEEAAHLTTTARSYRTLAANIAGQPTVPDDGPSLLTLAGPTSASLISDPQVVVPITFENVGSRDAQIWLLLAHDPQVLDVDIEAGPPVYRLSELRNRRDAERSTSNFYPDRPDLAGESPSLRLAGGQTSFVRLTLRRKNAASTPTRIIVKALATAAELEAVTYIRHTVEVDVPGTDAVALRVTGVPGTWNETESKLSLFPFANDVTAYQLGLVNPHTEAMQADVQWLTSESLAGLTLPNGSLAPAEAERVLARLAPTKTVLASFPVTLSTNQVTPIPFPKPGPAPPAEPPADGAPPAPAAGEAAAAATSAETSLPAELLVVITDRNTLRQTLRLIEIRPQRPRRFLRPQIGYDPQRERIDILVKPSDVSLLPPELTVLQIRATGATLNGDPIDVEGSLDAEHPEFRATIPVPAARDRLVTLEFSVGGYPRAFVYEVPCWAAVSDIPEKGDLLRVQITGLPQGQSYQSPSGRVAVKLQVDAPLGAFENVADEVRVGFDLNRDRELTQDPLVVLRSDRQVSLSLDHTSPEGEFAVRTNVRDFQVTLPPPPLRSARVNVLAQLTIASRSSWSEPVEVVFDALPPRVFQPRLAPGPELPQGTKELAAAFLASDDELSGVQRVEAALDLLGTGSFAPDAKPNLAIPNSVTGTWDIKIPAADLTPGAYRLLARAVDAVGNVGDYASVTFRVVPPASPTTESGGEVRGRVVYRQEPMGKAEVSIKAADGSEIPATTTDEQGNFVFNKLPAGKYRLSARAVIHNRPRIADLDYEVPAPPATSKPVELQLQ